MTIGLGVLVVGVLVWSLIPKPVKVDSALVKAGIFEEKVVEDGTTRVRDKYIVSSPVDGILPRLTWNPGDHVKKGEVLFRMQWDEDRKVLSPVGGEVLRVLLKDKGFVTKGTPIVELGDASSLEIVVDVLTSNAVAVQSGDPVLIEGWGGAPLQGKVRQIEPSAFTKVSALGVEEQRVNVVVDITSPQNDWVTLGDHFRVECHIIVDRIENAVLAPTAALFQSEGSWAVYRIKGGVAVLTPIRVGKKGPVDSTVLEGLSAGDRVVVYPGDAVESGVRVTSLFH